ncbi:MAG: hypothetical protein ACOCZE_03825 [Planctomycetota bacterium]
MADLSENGTAGDRSGLSVGGLLRREAAALVVSLGICLAATVGLFALSQHLGAAVPASVLLSVAGGCVWVCLASAPLAAGGVDGWGALLRGGMQADGCGLGLAVVWIWANLSGPLELGFHSLLAVYGLLAAISVGAVAAVCWFPRRLGWAVLVGLLLLALCATPFWTGGLVEHSDGERTDALARFVIRWNPFYGMTGALIGEVGFIWHQDAPLLYQRIAQVGPHVPPAPVTWSATFWRFVAAAAVAAVVALGLGQYRRSRSWRAGLAGRQGLRAKGD